MGVLEEITKGAQKAQRYTFRQLEELWERAGGDQSRAAEAAAIALAESGGNPNAIKRNSNGTFDRGLWQINSAHGALSTTGVDSNAKAAVRIQEESGWGVWTTFKTGAYKRYLTRQNIESGTLKISPNSPVLKRDLEAGRIAAEGGTDAAAGGIVGSLSPFKFTWNGLAEIGIRLILVLAGALLLVYGVAVAVRPRESALSLPKMPAVVPV